LHTIWFRIEAPTIPCRLIERQVDRTDADVPSCIGCISVISEEDRLEGRIGIHLCKDVQDYGVVGMGRIEFGRRVGQRSDNAGGAKGHAWSPLPKNERLVISLADRSKLRTYLPGPIGFAAPPGVLPPVDLASHTPAHQKANLRGLGDLLPWTLFGRPTL
jgi:hypothetical protein